MLIQTDAEKLIKNTVEKLQTTYGYTNAIHITCMANLLANVSNEVHKFYPEIDRLYVVLRDLTTISVKNAEFNLKRLYEKEIGKTFLPLATKKVRFSDWLNAVTWLSVDEYLNNLAAVLKIFKSNQMHNQTPSQSNC